MEAFSSILGACGYSAGSKYIKKKLIGRGSYGDAWLVEHAKDHTIFVAKVMDLGRMSSNDLLYARSEIKCLAICDHPNIIHFVEDHEENNKVLIIMEFADSGDLDGQLKVRFARGFSYFKEHEALFLFLQICLALDHIHSHKMLHRDIKAANILLTSTGLIKLGDFGFSHQYDDTVSGVVANTFCGTPYYLAPELWKNQRYSKKADVWSLGVLLYEILALRRPFTATNMKGLMARILDAEYAPLPRVFSADLNNLVRSILVVDANKRPSVREIFQIPYVRDGLKLFMQTICENTQICGDIKASITAHITEILSSRLQPEYTMGLVGQINNDVSFNGPVWKLSSGSSCLWKERYLRLISGKIVLLDTEADQTGKALSLEHLRSVCPVPLGTAKREFVFAVNTIGGKSMWFQALSHENMEMWIHKIQQGLGIS